MLQLLTFAEVGFALLLRTIQRACRRGNAGRFSAVFRLLWHAFSGEAR